MPPTIMLEEIIQVLMLNESAVIHVSLAVSGRGVVSYKKTPRHLHTYPKSDEIPRSPFALLRFDGRKISVHQHQLGVGQAGLGLDGNPVEEPADLRIPHFLHDEGEKGVVVRGMRGWSSCAGSSLMYVGCTLQAMTLRASRRGWSRWDQRIPLVLIRGGFGCFEALRGL